MPGPYRLTEMLQRPPPSQATATDITRSAGARELDGIGQQVEQHLLEAQLVGDDARQVRRVLRGEHKAGALGERAGDRQAALDDAHRLELGEGQRRHTDRLGSPRSRLSTTLSAWRALS